MKRTAKKMMAGTVALACLTLGAGGLHAQVTQVVTIKATASVQGVPTYSYNSHTGIATYGYAAPTKHSVATKDLLVILALDENAGGNYLVGTNFPSGAKLVIDGNSGRFQVLGKTNNLLVDVSDIMTAIYPGTNNIQSGKSTSLNHGLGTSTDLQLLTIKFDDTTVPGNAGLQFFLTGIGTGKTADTTPNKTTGAYTESSSGSLSSGTGEGSYLGNPFVCAGTASASGKATLNINPSPNSNFGSQSGGFIIYANPQQYSSPNPSFGDQNPGPIFQITP
jgi:hypothetical protein